MTRDPTIDHEYKPIGDVDVGGRPSWDALHALAEAQQGVFSADQAAEAGFSSQLLNKHLHGGRIERVQRGIYRLARFPAAQRVQQDLVVAWLWSGRVGVLSHETALQLHDLSDALPAQLHLTVPASWAKRRVHPPGPLRLYCADLAPGEITWVGSVPVTTPARAIAEVALAHGDATAVEAAVRQALRRNLASLTELAPAVAYVAGRGSEELEGSWVVDGLSGRPATAPPADWRVTAEAFARRHGAVLHAARLDPTTRVQHFELAWPAEQVAIKPTWEALRDEADEVFGWR